MFPQRGVWGISVTLLLPSRPMCCCAIEGLTSSSFLWPGETLNFLKEGPRNSRAPLSVVMFRLEFACSECTFFKALLQFNNNPFNVFTDKYVLRHTDISASVVFTSQLAAM